MPEGAVRYTFSLPAPSATHLQVDLRFRAGSARTTRLLLPDTGWGNEKRFYDAIEGLEVVADTGAAVTLRDADAPSARLLEHPPGAVVHVRYRLHQDWSGDRVRRFRPVFAERWLHFFGNAALARPAVDPDEPRPLEITWAGVPAGLTVADSFGVGEGTRRLTAPLSRVIDAVYVAGDFRLRRVPVGDEPVWVAVRGDWKFTDDALMGLLQKLLAAQRGFWNDHAFPHFLVTLIQDGGQGNYGGTGVTNAFSAISAPDRTLDSGLDLLFSHELFHTWNGRKIGTPPPEGGSYWFSEGFTTYYGRLLALRAGVIPLARYVADLDDEIGRYTLSPARNAPNARVVSDFWNDHALHDLSYQRGDLLAHAWNAAIREATSGHASLDDVMRDALAAALDRGERVTAASLDALARKYLPAGIAADHARYVEQGETIPPRPGALGPCVTLAAVEMPVFELGFDRAAVGAKVIHGVVPGSAAERAGVREGQALHGVSIWYGDTSKEVRLVVVDAGGKRTITYRPLGKPQRIPQYRLDEPAMARDAARCLAWFSPAGG
jgi:predicted metalloprotease with PDZ domain